MSPAPAAGPARALGAILCGVLTGVALKRLAHTAPARAIALRSLLVAALLAGVALATRAPILRLAGRALSRAVLDAAAGLAFALAVFELPLALLFAILAALPLVSVLLSRLWHGEPIGRARGAALLVGLAGVLCVLCPSLAISPLGLALAAVSVAAYAARDAVTRRLPAGTRTLSVALASALKIAACAPVLPGAAPWCRRPPRTSA